MGARAGMCMLAEGLWLDEFEPIRAPPRVSVRSAGRWMPLDGESPRWEIEPEEDEAWREDGPRMCGLNLGLCAGVASGVWSGVGLSESCEKEGEEGAVDCGEIMEGREGE